MGLTAGLKTEGNGYLYEKQFVERRWVNADLVCWPT